LFDRDGGHDRDAHALRHGLPDGIDVVEMQNLVYGHAVLRQVLVDVAVDRKVFVEGDELAVFELLGRHPSVTRQGMVVLDGEFHFLLPPLDDFEAAFGARVADET